MEPNRLQKALVELREALRETRNFNVDELTITLTTGHDYVTFTDHNSRYVRQYHDIKLLEATTTMMDMSVIEWQNRHNRKVEYTIEQQMDSDGEWIEQYRVYDEE